MLEILALPLLLQSLVAPSSYYEPHFSDDALVIFEEASQGLKSKHIRSLKKLADNGDDSALEILGEIYYFGLYGIDRDPKRACDYFERIGDRRADGLHNQATCYFAGDGRAQDWPRARALYAQAAQSGYMQSYCAYGNMLVRGEGGPVDSTEGLRLCRITAIAGDANAQTDYGGYLLTGRGTERDPQTARFMLEEAARQGQANAAFLLAQIYGKGDGTPVDHAQASKWFEVAYDNGRIDAAFENGMSLARIGFRQEGEEMYVREEELARAQEWFKVTTQIDPREGQRKKASEMIANLQALIEASRR